MKLGLEFGEGFELGSGPRCSAAKNLLEKVFHDVKLGVLGESIVLFNLQREETKEMINECTNQDV